MKHDIKALRDLEMRLEEAKGPNRVLDFWIAVELGPNPLKSDTGTEARPNWVQDSGQEFELWGAEGRYGFIGYHVVPSYTASLDAAVALVERVLPDASIHIHHFPGNKQTLGSEAIVGPRGKGFKNGHPALAICLACVRALISQGEQ